MLYNFPGNFMDKTIEFDGSTFFGEAVSAELLSVIRFRVIHCIADSGGELPTIYYQPFKATISYLYTQDWNTIEDSDEPYIYKMYEIAGIYKTQKHKKY
ncbi:TIGR03943 family putative permease subunit [Peribacillus butanolivorans]|uniref:TIGR03943 family putative permease subunit n=1 Tax=Peribacillus butanolivorans TaxID=421767 RepID=UPI0034D95939